jgi:hypothetical protein
MADLRIDDVSTADAAAALVAAANRLVPVIGALRGLDVGVAGANAFADALEQDDQSLSTALDNLGRALTGLAASVDGAAAGLAATDRALAAKMPAQAAAGASAKASR